MSKRLVLPKCPICEKRQVERTGEKHTFRCPSCSSLFELCSLSSRGIIPGQQYYVVYEDEDFVIGKNDRSYEGVATCSRTIIFAERIPSIITVETSQGDSVNVPSSNVFELVECNEKPKDFYTKKLIGLTRKLIGLDKE